MRCEKAREWIPLLAEDDLAGRRAERLRRHLESCRDCRRELESARVAIASMKAAARREPVEDWPASSWKALMSRITLEKPGSRRPMPGPDLRWAFASGAAGILLVAGLLFLFKDRVFRPEGISSIPAPAVVEKKEASPWPEFPPQPKRSESRQKQVPGIEPRILAAGKTDAGPEIKPATSAVSTEQDVVSVTLISRESGLQVVWFFDKNFAWKGDER